MEVNLKRYGLYLIRWQLSTPILAGVLMVLSSMSALTATVIANLIGACAIPFMTVLYDATGGYALAYNILLVMNIVAFVLMLVCRKTYAED